MRRITFYGSAVLMAIALTAVSACDKVDTYKDRYCDTPVEKREALRSLLDDNITINCED